MDLASIFKWTMIEKQAPTLLWAQVSINMIFSWMCRNLLHIFWHGHFLRIFWNGVSYKTLIQLGSYSSQAQEGGERVGNVIWCSRFRFAYEHITNVVGSTPLYRILALLRNKSSENFLTIKAVIYRCAIDNFRFYCSGCPVQICLFGRWLVVCLYGLIVYFGSVLQIMFWRAVRELHLKVRRSLCFFTDWNFYFSCLFYFWFP